MWTEKIGKKITITKISLMPQKCLLPKKTKNTGRKEKEEEERKRRKRKKKEKGRRRKIKEEKR